MPLEIGGKRRERNGYVDINHSATVFAQQMNTCTMFHGEILLCTNCIIDRMLIGLNTNLATIRIRVCSMVLDFDLEWDTHTHKEKRLWLTTTSLPNRWRIIATTQKCVRVFSQTPFSQYVRTKLINYLDALIDDLDCVSLVLVCPMACLHRRRRQRRTVLLSSFSCILNVDFETKS